MKHVKCEFDKRLAPLKKEAKKWRKKKKKKKK